MDQNNLTNDPSGTGTLYVGNPSGQDSGNAAWHIDTQSGLGAVTGWLDTKTTVYSYNQTSYDNRLTAVTDASPTDANDVWSVGWYEASNGHYQPFAEHWNGSSWSTDSTHDLPSPEVGSTTDNYLNGVAAFGSTNVWAVGYYVDSGGNETLLENWNGSGWTQSTLGAGIFYAIAVVPVSSGTSSEAWAVGTSSTGKALAYHTTDGGSTWTEVTDNTYSGQLFAVSASSSTNVWAVGQNSSGNTFTMQWTGSSWTVQTSPSWGSNGSSLWGVTAISSSDVWAVGKANNGSSNHAIAIHWDGSAWDTTSTATIFGSYTYLYAVFALNSNNVWAVGTDTGNGATLVEQYTGSSNGWSQVSSDSPYLPNLYGVTIDPNNGNVWAVGNRSSNGQTLTEFFD